MPKIWLKIEQFSTSLHQANLNVNSCLLTVSLQKSNSEENFKKHAQKFVTQWSYFISRIVRDLTLRSAPSFGNYLLT